IMLRRARIPNDRLWAILLDRRNAIEHRFSIACVLADDSAEDKRWESVANEIAQELAGKDRFQLNDWAKFLVPIRVVMLPQFESFIQNVKRTWAERGVIAGLF